MAKHARRHRRARLAPAALALAAALLWWGPHPHQLPTTYASFHHAACWCPLCLVDDGMVEISFGEYC